MGMGNVEDPSRRCVGRAETILSRSGVVKQAAPLSVAQICKIHDLLHAEGTSRWDKALCAYLLLCLYGRARHSDFKNIERVEWDVKPLSEGVAEEGREGYIVVYTRNHKTSRATAKKLKLLPIIIPVSGVHGRPWAFAARSAFERVGLVLEGHVSGPLFKPPKSFEELGLCDRSITSEKVSVFLRLVLNLPVDPPDDSPKVSSHTSRGTEAIYSVELGLPHVQKLEVLMTFIRRLLFEAQTLALSQLRLQITEPESAAKRVPEAERDRRMTLMRAELTGLSIEGPLEPGRKLLDECAHQEATGQLKYLAPDRCVSRIHEVTNAKNASRQVEIDQSKLIVREAQDELSMPASSALQVQEALRRRGLAYTFAQALSWSACDRYLMRLFSHMHREPPPNHNRVSVTQVVEADRLVFVKLIEQNIKAKRDASGSFPLDDALHHALESYEVSFALMHLQSKQAPPTRPPFKKLKTQHDESSVTKPGGKGKGKDKKGGHAATPSGEPICFTYSIHGKCNAEAGTGRILCFNQGVISFDSHKFHATEPWTGALQQAHFALPDIGTADIFHATSSAPAFPVCLELFSGL
ncbi:unnamed protein product, partial [Symbiodinium sp. KB8]